MAITSNPLELGSFQAYVVFAWIVREGLLSVKGALAKESRSFRLAHIKLCSDYDYFFASLLWDMEE